MTFPYERFTWSCLEMHEVASKSRSQEGHFTKRSARSWISLILKECELQVQALFRHYQAWSDRALPNLLVARQQRVHRELEIRHRRATHEVFLDNALGNFGRY